MDFKCARAWRTTAVCRNTRHFRAGVFSGGINMISNCFLFFWVKYTQSIFLKRSHPHRVLWAKNNRRTPLMDHHDPPMLGEQFYQVAGATPTDPQGLIQPVHLFSLPPCPRDQNDGFDR